MKLEIKKNNILAQIKNFCDLQKSSIINLEDFVLLLLKENQNYNLIGKSTIEDIWNRHILDSAQLLKYIDNKNLKCADFGTGSGFPGIILSMLGLKEIHLIEKSFRKCEFLRKAKLLSPNRVFVYQAKLEELKAIEFDVICSRALAPLDELMSYGNLFLRKNGYCLFLKGKKLEDEIGLAKKDWKFDYEIFPSLSSEEGKIIKIYNIKPILQNS
jgi:16S rRNA (guanine527-N7)-methyltransferase